MASSLRVREFFQVVFRHKWKVMGFFTAVMLAAWAALVYWPRTYESEAKLMIRVGRESVSLDPTATTSQTLMLQKSQEDEIKSAVDVLNSRHLAEQVVDSLGPDQLLNQSIGTGDADEASAAIRPAAIIDDVVDWCLTNAQVRDDISDRELAVRRLHKHLSVYAPKQSTVITMRYQAKSPELAQQTVAEVTEAYLREHLRISHTDGSQEFFVAQSAQLEEALQVKIDEVNHFRKTHGIVSIAANQDLLKEQLSGVEAELRTATVALEKSTAELADLKTQITHLEPELVSAKVGSVDPIWAAMRQRIFELEVQEKELDAKLTSEHPLLQHVRSQLASVRENFKEREEERVDATTTPNPVVQSLTEKLLSQESQSAGIKTSIESLKARRQEVRDKLDELINLEASLTQKEREVAILDTNFRNHQQKLEEARIIDALQEQKISNVNVVQPATYVEKAISPNKRVIAAMALFVALFGGIGMAFAFEAMDPTLRTTEQAETQLELPVLSSIPANLRQGDLLQSLTSTSPADVMDVNCKSLLQQVFGSQPQASETATTLGVLGMNAGCGGSTLAARLAIVASRDLGLSTLLVDTDNEEKFVARAFRLNGSPGLREMLSNEADEADCIQRISEPNLAVISSAAQDSPGALKLDTRDVAARLDGLRRQYDLVIVDMPPAAASSDGISLAAMLDHVLLVVQSEKTVGRAAKRVLDQLVRSHAKLSGVVLTKTREHLPRWLSRMV